MTLKCSVFIATSLDGFIAKADGDIQWLVTIPAPDAKEDYGFQAFFDSVDVLAMGRKTYEAALTFAEWPYAGKRVIVLSHRMPEVPERLIGQVEFMAGTPSELVHTLEGEGIKHAYIDGGKTIHGFLSAGLINEMTITTIPILLGEGIPLFGYLKREIKLDLLDSKWFANGFVKNRYRVLGER